MCGLFAGHGSGKRTPKFDLQTHSAPGRDLNQAPKTCGSSRSPAAATHRVSYQHVGLRPSREGDQSGGLAVFRLLGSSNLQWLLNGKIRLASRPLKDAIDVADHTSVLVKRFRPTPYHAGNARDRKLDFTTTGYCRLMPRSLSNTASIGPSDKMLPWLLREGAYKLEALPPSRNKALGQFSPSRNRRAKASNDTSP
jgi:hypothetical protein